MRRRVVTWVWEDPDAQRAFADWVGFSEEDAPVVVSAIESLLSMIPPLDVLDVGCGIGCHSIEMARRGYRVIGIDVAQSYLSQAAAKAQDQGLQIEFRLQRGSEITDHECYDVALAFNHTLGFMPPTELHQHFEREGQFILSEKRIEDGYRLETSIVIDTMRDEIIEYREQQRVFSLDDVLPLLKAAGFDQVVPLADLQGNEATASAFSVFLCHVD